MLAPSLDATGATGVLVGLGLSLYLCQIGVN